MALPAPPKRMISNEEIIKMLREDMTAALGDVMEIIQSAKEAGFLIAYSTAEIEGVQKITRLDVVKAL